MKISHKIFGSVLVCLMGWASFVWAQTAGKEADKSTGSSFVLSLGDVTALALQNNFEIQLAKFDASIAKTKEGVAESIYDTILKAEVNYLNDQKARTSTILGTKSVDNNYNIGFSRKLPSGTTLDVDMANNRNWSNSPFTTSSLSHDSSLGLTVTQALGKNFFGIQDRGDIKVTRLDSQNAQHLSWDDVESSLAKTQEAYWDLVLAMEQQKIEEEMTAQAERLYLLHKEKIKDGLIEAPEFFASEANLRNRQDELAIARNATQASMNTLKLRLNISDDDTVLVPSEEFAGGKENEDFLESLKTALEKRRDYQRVLNDVKSRDIRLTMNKNNLWPEMNLQATWLQNGLGDHFPQAVRNISEQNNPEFFAGLIFSVPLENTKARSQLTEGQLQKAKALVALKFIERRIATEILNQVNACNIFRQSLESNRAIVDLQTNKLAEEEKRFNSGRSDTDTLIRFQEDLLQARLRLASAKHRYAVSQITLKWLKSSLLDSVQDGL